jgi:hypothetical protein
MPIKLSKSLLDWLERKSPKAKMEQLVSTIGEINSLIQGREDTLSALVRQHISMAEADCNAALENFKFNDKSSNEECMRRILFGLFRLELAKQQLTAEHAQICPPNFPIETAEHSVLELSGAIIQTKMALEFSNCVIKETTSLRLFTVVKMFNEAVELLRSNYQDQIKRKVEAALFMLYLVKLEIELDNKETIIDLQHDWAINSRESKPLIDSFKTIYRLKETCSISSSPVPARVTSQLEVALGNFDAALEAFVREQDDISEKLAVTGKIQAELAEKSLANCSTAGEETAKNQAKALDELEKRTKQFKTRIVLLQRLINKRASQAELARRRLDAALQYYLGAVHSYRKAAHKTDGQAEQTSQAKTTTNSQQKLEQLAQATSLTRAARIDLEFARNLLFVNE